VSFFLVLVVISCHCCCPCIDCLLLHINISLIILIVDSHNMMHSPHHPLSLYPVVPFQCYHPSSSSLCNCLSCHCLPSKWFRCTSLSSLMSLVPRTSNWLLHWHGMPCWSSLSSFSSSLVLADVHRDFYWLLHSNDYLHSIDYWIIFAPHFPLFVPRRRPRWRPWRRPWRHPLLFIGYGMKTARYPFELPAMHRDPVRAIIYTPSRHHHDRSSIIIMIPSTKNTLRSSSPSSFIRRPPPQLLRQAGSGDYLVLRMILPSTQFRRDFWKLQAYGESFSTQRDGGKPKEGNRESPQIGRERWVALALKLKRNLDFNCKSQSLSIYCHYLDELCYYWDNQFVWAFSRCVENDSGEE
jgi:hypothetical protein